MELNGNRYKYVFDENGSVIGLYNESDILVSAYRYEDGKTIVYSLDEYGNWEVNEDEKFIGNINRIRFCGYYYDAETSWYYCGRYYDINQECFIDGQFLSEIEDETNPFLLSEERAISTEEAILQWRNKLLSSSTYGRPIDYSVGWYDSLSTVEILARLLYGENTALVNDQCAVAWVVLNRVNTSYNGQNGVREVITAANPSQFAPITGTPKPTYDETKHARIPATTSLGWANATTLACTICTTTNESECISLITKPPKITDLFFGNGIYDDLRKG